MNLIQPCVWKELLLAAIGEQFENHISPQDKICGVSISVREKDDLLQIWNGDCTLSNQASVLEKVFSLMPHIRFNSSFYKCKYLRNIFTL